MPKLLKANEEVVQVDVFVLTKFDPVTAPMYSSQESCIFSFASEVLEILAIVDLTATTESVVLVSKDLILSVVSTILNPEV